MAGTRGMPIRALLGRALAVGLTIAAATAIVALLTGSVSDTDARIIGTSLGFSVFSATAAAGAAARDEGRGFQRAVGAAAFALSLAAFAALLFAIWVQPDGGSPWQVWGCLAVAALVASHASLVLRARRRGDGGLVRALVTTSLLAATLDGLLAIAGIADLVDDISDAAVRVAAVAGVVMLLTSALPPIIRRVSIPGGPPARTDLAAEVIAATGRILASKPDPDVARECERLRDAARGFVR